MIPDRISDLKTFFSSLKLRYSSTMVWTNIRNNSSSDMAGNMDQMEDELGGQGIMLFIQPIQECNTRVIVILTQLLTNRCLAHYQAWLVRRLKEGVREAIGDQAEELQLALYLCTP